MHAQAHPRRALQAETLQHRNILLAKHTTLRQLPPQTSPLSQSIVRPSHVASHAALPGISAASPNTPPCHPLHLAPCLPLLFFFLPDWKLPRRMALPTQLHIPACNTGDLQWLENQPAHRSSRVEPKHWGGNLQNDGLERLQGCPG